MDIYVQLYNRILNENFEMQKFALPNKIIENYIFVGF